jgi:hypothetical protein
MNGDMEMHLKSQDIDLMQRDEPVWLLRFLPLGSTVDSTYVLQADFWTGMRASCTDSDLATRQCRYAESPRQILRGRRPC